MVSNFSEISGKGDAGFIWDIRKTTFTCKIDGKLEEGGSHCWLPSGQSEGLVFSESYSTGVDRVSHFPLLFILKVKQIELVFAQGIVIIYVVFLRKSEFFGALSPFSVGILNRTDDEKENFVIKRFVVEKRFLFFFGVLVTFPTRKERPG